MNDRTVRDRGLDDGEPRARLGRRQIRACMWPRSQLEESIAPPLPCCAPASPENNVNADPRSAAA